MPNVLIASYLEPEHVERLRRVDRRIDVVYAPDLLRPPRYPADHTGRAIDRTPEQEARWRALLAEAEILFDFDHTHRADLPELAPGVRWIQATSAGIGQLVKRLAYDTRMPGVVFTTASGVHARPLAEFVIMSLLYFAKGGPRMVEDQRERRWARYAGTELGGATLGIVGVGRVGREVARLARAFGMRTIGTRRRPGGIDPGALDLDELHGPDGLGRVLDRAHYLVLCAPHTGETERMLGAPELARLPRGAVIVNIGRGALVDEVALVEALESGHLGGASLDVFVEEPPPPDSRLWTLPGVLVSPHSGSTSDRENMRLTELFADNLRRYLAGEPLVNVLDVERMY